MLTKILMLLVSSVPLLAEAQLIVQRNAGLFVDKHCEIIVEGDINIDEDISGDGALVLSGTSMQQLKANRIPNLVISNNSDVTLANSIYIDGSLQLLSGKLICGSNNLSVSEKAIINGNGNSYISTGSLGKVIKFIGHDLNNYLLPIGTTNAYTPVFLNSSGPYSAASVAFSAGSEVSPHKPGASSDYINNYWAVVRKGVAGNIRVAAQYQEVNGDEELLGAHYWDGRKWLVGNYPLDQKRRLVNINIPEGAGEIFAMRADGNNSAVSSISLQPNPVQNIAIVQLFSAVDRNTSISVNDANGRVAMVKQVKLNKGNNQVQLNVSSLSNGSYSVREFNGERWRTLQFVKGSAK